MTYSREEISELLSLYDTDELTSQEREAVEQCLESDEDVRSELEAQRAMQEMFAEMGDNLERPQPDVLKRIEANIDALAGSPEKKTEPLYGKMWGYIRSLLPKPQFAWGVATVQMAVLVLLVSTYHPESSYQTLSHSPTATKHSATLNIVFDPASMEQDIRKLLRTIDASIVEGPTRRGAVHRRDPGRGRHKNTLLQTLRSSKIIQMAEPSL